jgi:hypothetical protein
MLLQRRRRRLAGLRHWWPARLRAAKCRPTSGTSGPCPPNTHACLHPPAAAARPREPLRTTLQKAPSQSARKTILWPSPTSEGFGGAARLPQFCLVRRRPPHSCTRLASPASHCRCTTKTNPLCGAVLTHWASFLTVVRHEVGASGQQAGRRRATVGSSDKALNLATRCCRWATGSTCSTWTATPRTAPRANPTSLRATASRTRPR